jgi:hypothetical protein
VSTTQRVLRTSGPLRKHRPAARHRHKTESSRIALKTCRDEDQIRRPTSHPCTRQISKPKNDNASPDPLSKSPAHLRSARTSTKSHRSPAHGPGSASRAIHTVQSIDLLWYTLQIHVYADPKNHTLRRSPHGPRMWHLPGERKLPHCLTHLYTPYPVTLCIRIHSGSEDVSLSAPASFPIRPEDLALHGARKSYPRHGGHGGRAPRHTLCACFVRDR